MQLPDSASVAEALTRVYSRPEFATREPSGLLRTIAELWAAFRHWVGTLLRRLAPDSLPSIFMWTVLAVLVALALWALYALFISLNEGRAATPVRQGTGVRLAAREDAAWWEQQARAAAASGRFRDAALALYLAAVLRLEHRGLLRYESGKTPGDYRREVRGSEVSTPFDTFIRALLPVAFGSRDPDVRAYDAVRLSATELGVNA